jgi:hypothetical protein
MLDILGIVASSLLMMFIVIRALRLDRQLPWFGSGNGEGRTADRRRSTNRPEPFKNRGPLR